VDFIEDIFNLLPLKAATIIILLSYLASRLVKRDEKGRLPHWFPAVPLVLGVLIGIPSYLLEHMEEILTQAIWVTVLRAGEQGVTYGAAAIGLWSARYLIPYFKKISEANDANGSAHDEPQSPTQGGVT